MSVKQIGKTRREPLTDSQLLMTITIGIFAVMYAAAMIFMGGGFLRTQQFFDLLNDNAALIIISCALTIVMIGGGINISVGGVIGLTVMACALYLNNTGIQNSTLGIVVTLLLALGIGLAFGVLQGFLISYLDIQPFIVTLAGMFLSRGLTTMLSVNPVKVTHEGFLALVKNRLAILWLGYTAKNGNLIAAKLEIGAIVALAVVVLVYLMLRYMKLGRHIYALGGNQQSALMLGINVKRTRFISYVISGLLSGLAYAVCELPNSFVKRRVDIRPGKTEQGATGKLFFVVDQIDSLLGVFLVLKAMSGISWTRYAQYILVGAGTHVGVNLVLYKLHIRKNL